MIRLYAGPWVGEFGWLLFGWQGYFRNIAEDYDRVIIIGEPSMKYLYQDYATHFVDFKVIGDNRNMWANDPQQVKNPMANKGDVWIKAQQLTLMENTPQQKFVKYGTKGAEQGFDIVCHSRSLTKYGSDYVNTPPTLWKKILSNFNGLNVASVGTKEGADHIPGTIDRRGISLEGLADTLTNSKILIGPSSGPMHYGALCDIPMIVWSGYERSALRYQKAWNPFKSPVKMITAKGDPWGSKTPWQPVASEIVESIERML